jgi:hypothetical protein
MDMGVEFRWLTFDEIADLLNPVCRENGFAELNVNPQMPTCRVMGAFADGVLLEAFAFQMYPMLGPLVKVEKSFRDDGEIARTLAQKMKEFLDECDARAYLVVADNPISERLCRRFGMEELSSPVYSYVKDAVVAKGAV